MIETFILFLGPVRTGHTFISSLLSAHPNISISLELQPIKKVLRGYNKERLFKEILQNCKNRQTMEMGGYEYLFSEEQKRIENTKVIGDSIAGFKQGSLINIKDLDKFHSVIKTPIKWIIIYRNPFDVVTSSDLMNKRGIGRNISDFIKITNKTKMICEFKLVRRNVFSLHIEDFIKEPKKWLKQLCDFLNVKSTEKYLESCREKTFSKRKRVFDISVWNKNQIKRLNNFILETPELKRYYNEF